MNECTKTFTLPGLDPTLVATLTIVRHGQVAANESDEVQVKLTLTLPAGRKLNTYTHLPDEIDFGDRVLLADERLSYDWGRENNDKTGRYKLEYFNATTWHDAFYKADHWGTSEITKLITALRKRQQALIDAEADPEF